MPGEARPVDFALGYAARGLAVFPCHTIGEDGACTCQEVNPKPCESQGKHPRVYGGVKEATLDSAEIMRWWARWPTANIGIACGEISGIVVIDVDPRHDGDKSMQQLEQLRGLLPATHRVMTGGGGYHLFFKYPSTGCRNRNKWLPGIDVRSNGYYVVAPPSVHKSGLSYRWSSPEGLSGFAELPVDVLENIGRLASGRNYDTGTQAAIDALAGVPEGQRDDAIFRLACSLHRKLRGDREVIEAAVLIAAARCNPPFPEAEALKKVDQAFKQDHSDAPDIGPVLERLGIENFSDEGNARRFLGRWQDDARYVSAWGWLVWDGSRWKRDDTELIVDLARKTVQGIWTEVDGTGPDDTDLRRHITTWALKSEAAPKLEHLLKIARVDRSVARPPAAFDNDDWLLNCRNVAIELRGDVRARAQARDDCITMLAPVDWVEGARAPRWEAFLEKIQPNPDIRGFLKRAVGYSLTGSTREKVLFILYGSGRNGKTIFLETIRKMLGDYAAAAAKTIFVGRRGDAIPVDLAALVGKRFVTCAEEIEKGDRLNSGFLKSITGGDEMTARFMKQNLFEFMPRMKLWLGTNHQPGVNDFGPAMKERLIMVPWDVKILPHEEIDRDTLLDMLAEERAGILRWAVEGCIEWLARGLVVPLELELCKEGWLEEEDTFREWLDEFVVVGEGWCSTESLHLAYRNWCMSRGDDVRMIMGPKNFVKELKVRGVMQRKYNNRRGFVCSLVNTREGVTGYGV